MIVRTNEIVSAKTAEKNKMKSQKQSHLADLKKRVQLVEKELIHTQNQEIESQKIEFEGFQQLVIKEGKCKNGFNLNSRTYESRIRCL